jgi:transcription elongation factor Elf1
MSIVHFVSTATNREFRVCPHCEHRQSVAATKARETVHCTKCNSRIPPKKDQR